MRKWTMEKLDRELAFAEGSVGDDPRAAAWLVKLQTELRRRNAKTSQPSGH